MARDHKETTEFGAATSPGDGLVAASFLNSDIEIAALTHRGMVRRTNEDQYAVIRRTRSGVVLSSSLAEGSLPDSEEHSWLLTVADGLGGQVSGEVASETAIRTMIRFANGLSSWIMRPTDGLRDDIAERIDLYVEAIQQEMRRQTEMNPALAGMATTVTGVYVFGSSVVVANVGDSRSYLIRSSEIYQITEDHTLAQEMLERGGSADAARPFHHVLTRCLSGDAEPASVDLFHLKPAAGDRILLCTDGLTDMVDDDAILRIVRSASTKDACEQLIRAALNNGGRDNVTVVLARL